MRRIELSLIIGMIASIIISSVGIFGSECAGVRAEVLRLHVMANSDTPQDQALKLLARDAVLSYAGDLFDASGGKEDVLAAAREHLSGMEQAARGAIRESGGDYAVTAEIANMYFETREYDGITLPAGRYDAVRLTIGAGEGKNWWCVMFPPMCVPAAGERHELEDQIIHLGEVPQYIPKFAVVELIERLRE